jgi:hypothetical protein
MSVMRPGNRFRRHGHGGLSNAMSKRSNAPWRISQENTRMEVSKEIAKTHIRNLERYVKDVPMELVLNVDDVGCQ